MTFVECPICKSKSLAEIKPSVGTDFCITELDKDSNPPTFIPAGQRVKLMGCVNCKFIIPMFDTSILENT